MLLLKYSLHHAPTVPDYGQLTRYELNAYPFEIIIGLQRYGFSQNWQTFSSFFKEADYQSQAMLGHKTSNVPMQKIACFASEHCLLYPDSPF